jgi:hemolysin activation/secretion protein
MKKNDMLCVMDPVALSDTSKAVLAAKGLRAATVIWLAIASGAAWGQAAPPSPGQILRDIERSVPSRPMTTPEGASIEIPDAPAATADSMKDTLTVSGYRIAGNTAFDEQTLLGIIAGRTGRLLLTDLDAVAGELTRFYREQGYLVARAYVPQQQIKDGIVTLAVLEGRYGQINTSGLARVSAERARRTVASAICPSARECQGAIIDRHALERGLLVLNDTPGARAAGRLSPGNQTGTSTLDLDLGTDRLFSGSAMLDNAGSYYTGAMRAAVNLWMNSPLGIGDQLNLQAVGSDVHGNVGYGGIGYSVPLGYDGLRIGVRGWRMYYKLGDVYSELDAHGTVHGGDATLSYPFIRSQSANLYGSIEYGERRFRDAADALALSNRRRISDRVEAALSGDYQDALFEAGALNSYSLAYTKGRVGLDSTLSLFDAISARTAGRYDKVTGMFSRLQSISSSSVLYLKILGQYASQNLDSYEKFSLGGPDTVRAYPSGDSLTDQAILYSVEWRQTLGQILEGPLEAAVFYDRASGHTNAQPWSGEPNHVALDGAGVGLNWGLSRTTTFRSYVAFRGNRPWSAAPDQNAQYGLMLFTAF